MDGQYARLGAHISCRKAAWVCNPMVWHGAARGADPSLTRQVGRPVYRWSGPHHRVIFARTVDSALSAASSLRDFRPTAPPNARLKHLPGLHRAMRRIPLATRLRETMLG